MTIRITMAAVSLALTLPTAAAAQTPRWNVGASVAWSAARTPDSETSRRRFHSVSADVEVARFWRTHIWTAVRTGRSTGADGFAHDLVVVPDAPTPLYRRRTRRYGFSDASVLVGYRAHENEWVHPYVSVGVRVERITRVDTVPPQSFSFDRTGTTRLAIPASTQVLPTLTRALPTADAGVDLYLHQRAFVRVGAVAAMRSGVTRLGARFAMHVEF